MSHEPGLEANLARLRARHPELAARVAAADASGIERVTGPRGARTLKVGGALLGSAYDPVREGEQLARQALAEGADLVVAIGFGLGHQLEAVRRLCEAPLLVYEPSAERLRAALALGEVRAWIGHETVHWAGDAGELGDRLRSCYAPGLRIQVLVHPVVLRLDAERVAEALEQVRRAKDAVDIDAFTWMRGGEEWARLTAENLPHLVSEPHLSALAGQLSGFPAVVVAAGPSLDRQLPLLAQVADRVLVIAIGQSLRALRRAGIEPHLVHVIDSADVSHQIRDAGDPATQNLVLFPSVHPSFYALPARSRFVAVPLSNPLACWVASLLGEHHVTPGAGTVAQSAVQIAAALGADPILLVGQDLAFTDGRVYASGSAYDMVSLRTSEDGRFVFTGFDAKLACLGREAPAAESPAEDLVWVEGWHGGRVPTSKGYASFIDQYRHIGAWLSSQGVRLVNCTEGGARLPGLEHLGFAEAVERWARTPCDAAGRIEACYAQAPRRSPQGLRQPLAQAGRALERLDVAIRQGLARARRTARELRRAQHPEHVVRLLRRLGRIERSLLERLQTPELSWLDAVSRPELTRDAAELRRAGSDPERCVADCERLLGSLQQAAARGRPLLEHLNRRLAEAEASQDATRGRAVPDLGARAAGSAPRSG